MGENNNSSASSASSVNSNMSEYAKKLSDMPVFKDKSKVDTIRKKIAGILTNEELGGASPGGEIEIELDYTTAKKNLEYYRELTTKYILEIGAEIQEEKNKEKPNDSIITDLTTLQKFLEEYRDKSLSDDNFRLRRISHAITSRGLTGEAAEAEINTEEEYYKNSKALKRRRIESNTQEGGYRRKSRKSRKQQKSRKSRKQRKTQKRSMR